MIDKSKPQTQQPQPKPEPPKPPPPAPPAPEQPKTVEHEGAPPTVVLPPDQM